MNCRNASAVSGSPTRQWSTPDMNERATTTKRTARHLKSLYVVGAGLGIAFALEGMIQGVGADPSLDWDSVPVVVAFLATLVPFFHGAMLFMDTQFRGSPLVVMIDFLALFSQTILFFVMAEFVREPTSFTIAWIVLLIVDVLWVGWLMTPMATRSKRQLAKPVIREYRPWAIINTLCIAVLAALLLRVDEADRATGPNLELGLLLAAVAIIRTLCDYGFSRRVYFGKGPVPGDTI